MQLGKRAALFLTLLFAPFILSGCSLLDFKGKAGLQVMTNDIPTSVYLNGKYLEKTPYINKELTPGEYTLELKPEDTALATYQTKISLKKGLLSVMTWKPGNRPETSGGVIYEMEALRDRKNSELSLTTIPDGAIVTLDGQSKGFSPVLVEKIAAGQHEYEISLPSYETQKHTINVLEGYRMNITVKLAKQEFSAATVTASATPAASPLPSPSPSSKASALPTTSPKASPSPSLSASPKTATSSGSITGASKGNVKITPTGFFNNGKEVLRVRDAASASGKELGFAEVGKEFPYANEKTDGWYKITFNGSAGWVSSQFAQLGQ